MRSATGIARLSAPDEPEELAHRADYRPIRGMTSAVEFPVGTSVRLHVARPRPSSETPGGHHIAVCPLSARGVTAVGFGLVEPHPIWNEVEIHTLSVKKGDNGGTVAYLVPSEDAAVCGSEASSHSKGMGMV
jgi:hypothetical protein